RVPRACRSRHVRDQRARGAALRLLPLLGLEGVLLRRPARSRHRRRRLLHTKEGRGVSLVSLAPELEVITMGRVGVDLYPEQIGVPLARVRTFAKSLGGSATNVAVACARLGHRSAVITRVGDDGFGIYVREALAGFGVDARWVGTDPALRTPIVFCEIYPP